MYLDANGALMAIRFDAKRDTVIGQSVPVIAGVVADGVGGAKAALSTSGTLAYQSGTSQSQPVLVDARGAATALLAEPRGFSTPRFSPDGGRVAFTVTAAAAPGDIWVWDRAKHTLTRLTTEATNIRPEWTPDGKRILFRSDRGGPAEWWWQPADGSGPAQLLYRPDEATNEAIMSPDSRWLIYRTSPGAQHRLAIYAVPLDGDRKPVPLVVNPRFSYMMPRLSPDGHWLAYRSNESGNDEIYVRPFPGEGARVQVSPDGGSQPVWARSGRTLFYRRNADVVAVAVTTGATFTIGERRVALSGDYLADVAHANYDVTLDGSQFLMLKHAGEEAQTIVVHNWGRELVARMAAKASSP